MTTDLETSSTVRAGFVSTKNDKGDFCYKKKKGNDKEAY